MKLNSFALALAVACSGAIWGCADGGTPLSPSSPSSLSSRPSLDAPQANLTRAPRYVDRDGDGYDDGPEETPAPETPTPAPPEGVPAPNQPPAVAALTVNIVGTFGAGAFVPNPLQAAIGNTIVWMNSDLISHVIVLDDGTPVGSLAPGQSSLPIPLATSTMGYHCTLHPSMVGQVTTVPAGEPVPTDPSQPSAPPPSGSSPPTEPYDDGYEDDYYLRPVR